MSSPDKFASALVLLLRAAAEGDDEKTTTAIADELEERHGRLLLAARKVLRPRLADAHAFVVHFITAAAPGDCLAACADIAKRHAATAAAEGAKTAVVIGVSASTLDGPDAASVQMRGGPVRIPEIVDAVRAALPPPGATMAVVVVVATDVPATAEAAVAPSLRVVRPGAADEVEQLVRALGALAPGIDAAAIASALPAPAHRWRDPDDAQGGQVVVWCARCCAIATLMHECAPPVLPAVALEHAVQILRKCAGAGASMSVSTALTASANGAEPAHAHASASAAAAAGPTAAAAAAAAAAATITAFEQAPASLTNELLESMPREIPFLVIGGIVECRRVVHPTPRPPADMVPGSHFCALCNVVSNCEDNWRAHMAGQQHSRRKVQASAVHFYCPLCGSTMMTAQALLQHVATSKHVKKAGAATRKCPTCGAAFLGDEQIVKHLSESALCNPLLTIR